MSFLNGRTFAAVSWWNGERWLRSTKQVVLRTAISTDFPWVGSRWSSCRPNSQSYWLHARPLPTVPWLPPHSHWSRSSSPRKLFSCPWKCCALDIIQGMYSVLLRPHHEKSLQGRRNLSRSILTPTSVFEKSLWMRCEDFLVATFQSVQPQVWRLGLSFVCGGPRES